MADGIILKDGEPFWDGMPGASHRHNLCEMYAIWLQALEEAVGPQGWSPAFGVTSDGERRVLQIVDWVGGAGEKPTITGYVGASGIVPDAASAVDIRGAQGAQGPKGDKGDKGEKGDQGDIGPKGDTGPANSLSIGTVQDGPTADATITGTAPSQTLNLTLPKGDQGPKGDKGDQGDIGPKGDKGDKGDTGEKGDPGDDGWTPVMAVASDGERRVIEILDWTGGAGTKPATGYLGPTGVVSDIAQAIDVRGAPGAGAVSSVNSIDPDGSGNVDLGISDIPGLEDALDNAGQVKTVASKGPDGAGNVELDTSDITGLDDALGNKVDKITGYGLSQENYTLSEKQKLASLESSRWKGEFVSLGALQSAYPTAEPGDYADVDAGAGQNVRRYIWDDSDGEWVEQSGVVPPLTASQVKTLYESNPDTNGFTDALKSKLENLETQVPADWNASDGVARILNKPTAMSQGEAETGTATTPRLIDASVLKAAIIEHGGGGGDSYQTGDVLTTARTLSAPDWLLTNGAAYLRSAYPDLAMLLPSERKLANPLTLPTGNGRGCAFSPDGMYLSVTHDASPFITIYKRSGDTFTKLPNPADLPTGNGRGCAFSPDGQYLSVAHDASPFVTIYKRSGGTFIKLPNPAALPTSTGSDCAFSPDGTYLSVAHSGSPYITIYKRSGDVFTKLSNPSVLPTSTGNGCAFSPDGQYLSVAHTSIPLTTIYKRSGDTFTKLSDPATLPAGIGQGCAFSPDGQYLSVAHSNSPFITIYKRSGDTFTKLPNPADLPASIGYGCAFSPDGQYLSVAHGVSPFVTIYKRSGDTFTKLADPTDLPTSTGSDCAFSPDGTYLSVAHSVSPFVTIYTSVGEETSFITPIISFNKTKTYIKT